jgi:hypothetical protein
MAWRVARSLDTLLAQINKAFPNRSKISDGSIGDTNHLAEGWTESDHNPWYKPPTGGVVTARDYTHDPVNGVDINRLSDELAASRDPRIKYIIANGLILDSRPGNNPWKWMPYYGTNRHDHHLHLSVIDSPMCDNDSSWNLPMLGVQSGEDMSPDERNALYDIREQLAGARPVGQWPGWPSRPDATDKPKSLVDYVRALHAQVRATDAKLDAILAKLP